MGCSTCGLGTPRPPGTYGFASKREIRDYFLSMPGTRNTGGVRLMNPSTPRRSRGAAVTSKLRRAIERNPRSWMSPVAPDLSVVGLGWNASNLAAVAPFPLAQTGYVQNPLPSDAKAQAFNRSAGLPYAHAPMGNPMMLPIGYGAYEGWAQMTPAQAVPGRRRRLVFPNPYGLTGAMPAMRAVANLHRNPAQSSPCVTLEPRVPGQAQIGLYNDGASRQERVALYPSVTVPGTWDLHRPFQGATQTRSLPVCVQRPTQVFGPMRRNLYPNTSAPPIPPGMGYAVAPFEHPGVYGLGEPCWSNYDCPPSDYCHGGVCVTSPYGPMGASREALSRQNPGNVGPLSIALQATGQIPPVPYGAQVSQAQVMAALRKRLQNPGGGPYQETVVPLA